MKDRNIFYGATVFVTVLCLVFASASFGSDSTFTASEIGLALDYAKSGLTKEAKDILIPLLHDNREPNHDSKVRYFLGAICFFLDGDENCATYHWERVLNEEPNGPESEVIRGFIRNSFFIATKLRTSVVEDFGYIDDLNTGRLLWSALFPDYKMDLSDLRDSALAMPYYDMLLEKYTSPRKHAQLLFEKFFILAGYNNEGFGYLKVKGSWKNDTADYRQEQFYFKECNEIADSLGRIPEATDYYVHSQFLLGVMTSGTKFLSSKIKLNETSARYFENVMRATVAQNTNLFRIFASVWLGQYEAKKKKG